MGSMFETLMKNEEDRVKEREELKKIEDEQRSVVRTDLMTEKKPQCIKALGVELYERIYNYLKNAKLGNKDSAIIQKDIFNMVGNDKDKMNMVFFIDQLVDKESIGI